MALLQDEIPEVLVCDDEAHIRHIIAHKLRSAGYRVAEARNGQEALDLLRREPVLGAPPKLIITDLQMPMVSGLDLCTALKQDPRTQGLRALMLTARGYILSDEELAQTIIKDVIAKPFGVRELLARVTTLIGPPALPVAAAA